MLSYTIVLKYCLLSSDMQHGKANVFMCVFVYLKIDKHFINMRLVDSGDV